MELLSSNVSLSAAARILRVNPKTVAKKLLFLGTIFEERNQKNVLNYRSVDHIQLDELQTIEGIVAKRLDQGIRANITGAYLA